MKSVVNFARGQVRPTSLLRVAAFKLRGALMVPVVAVLLLCTRWEHERDLEAWLVGLPIFMAGVGLRVWAQTHLRYRLRDGHALATSGPYAYMRNPVYIANMLLLAALAVLCELPWMVPITVAYAACVYHLAVGYEETRLEKRYGEAYRRYRARVPRWLVRLPRVKGCPRPPLPMWLRAAAVEWQCLLLLAVPVAKECLERVLPSQ